MIKDDLLLTGSLNVDDNQSFLSSNCGGGGNGTLTQITNSVGASSLTAGPGAAGGVNEAIVRNGDISDHGSVQVSHSFRGENSKFQLTTSLELCERILLTKRKLNTQQIILVSLCGLKEQAGTGQSRRHI